MSKGNQANPSGWTSTQAYVLAVICLLIGIAVGYLVRGSSSTQDTGNATAAAQMQANGMPAGMNQVTPEQLKHMADKTAEPMLKQLKSDPNDAALLARIGDTYYDAQQYNDAISYYDRSLKIAPLNTNVRTDMGTAYWYLGDADRAIQEFETVLKTEPDKSNTLMNLGIVQWQGKMDARAAVATWQKLLETNPNFQDRAQVEQFLAQAKQHLNVKPGTKTNKPAM